MYVRLAFAVAANLEPDILIVDEVLAVGDAKFQKKCLGKMNEITSNNGRTVIFVSHNMTAVKQLCNKAIHLHNGELLSYGNSSEIINSYLESSSSNFENEILNSISRLPICNYFKLHSIKLLQDEIAVQFFENSKEIEIAIEYEVFVETSRLYVIFEIIDSEGNIVTETCHNSFEERPVTKPGRYISNAIISKNSLAPIYHELKFYFGAFGDTNYYPPIQFGINVVTDGESNMMYKTRPLGGKVILPITWNIKKLK
jgi:lipopolysaccharide transport system ATP-binding protein